MIDTVCWECGNEIDLPRIGKRFCNNICRQSNYRSGGVRKFYNESAEQAEWIKRMEQRFFENCRGYGCKSCPKHKPGE